MPLLPSRTFGERSGTHHKILMRSIMVAEDFVLTSGGIDFVSRARFKEWVIDFQSKITHLEFDILESFQNAQGNRVASRWQIRGKNNGMLGTQPDQRDIRFTGTAVWAVRRDGVLLHNWVERSAWELYLALTQPPIRS